MKEVKGLSTISYNTEQFLHDTLERLKQEGKIVVYFYINHHAEEDEKKDHFHVWWLPAVGKRKIQEWRDYFVQSCNDDLTMFEKPLGCELIEKSEFGNEYLYCLHDEQYLQSKGEERKFHYSRDDIVFSNPDDFDHMIYTVGLHYQDYLGEARPSSARVFKFFDQGLSVYDILKKGYVKSTFIYQLQQLRKIYEQRPHGITINSNTGEIFDDDVVSDAFIHVIPCQDEGYDEPCDYTRDEVIDQMKKKGIDAMSDEEFFERFGKIV